MDYNSNENDKDDDNSNNTTLPIQAIDNKAKPIEVIMKELNDKIEKANSDNQKLAIQIKTYMNQIIAPILENNTNLNLNSRANSNVHKIDIPELFKFINDDQEEIEMLKIRIDKLYSIIDNMHITLRDQYIKINAHKDNINERDHQSVQNFKRNNLPTKTGALFKSKSAVNIANKEINEVSINNKSNRNYYPQIIYNHPTRTYYNNSNNNTNTNSNNHKFKAKKQFGKILFNHSGNSFYMKPNINNNNNNDNSSNYINSDISLPLMNNTRDYDNDPYYQYFLNKRKNNIKTSKTNKVLLQAIESYYFSLTPRKTVKESYSNKSTNTFVNTTGNNSNIGAFNLFMKETKSKIEEVKREMNEMKARFQLKIDEIKQGLLDTASLKKSLNNELINSSVNLSNSKRISPSNKNAFMRLRDSFSFIIDESSNYKSLIKSKKNFMYKNHTKSISSRSNKVFNSNDSKDKDKNKKIKLYSVSKVLTSKPLTAV